VEPLHPLRAEHEVRRRGEVRLVRAEDDEIELLRLAPVLDRDPTRVLLRADFSTR
jgi:hypothetical protein